jgi:hypothetical protein
VQISKVVKRNDLVKRSDTMEYEVGQIVKLKKQHPCGSQEWEILRVGADFRLKCMGCGHEVMTPRFKAEKNIRQVHKKNSST